MEISAEAYPIDLRTQQGPSYAVPVFFRIQCRITSLHEGRCTTQSHREQVRMQTQFMYRHIHARTQSCFVPGEDTFDQSIKAKLFKSSVVRLHTYPAVIVEDIRLFTVGMHHIDQLPAERNNEIIDKCHPIRLLRISRHMGHMKLSFIDEIFRCHTVTVLFLEFLQRRNTDGEIIRPPVREQIPIFLAAAPDPHKIIEHRGKTYHGGIRMGLTPVLHPAKQILLILRVSGIDLHQMLLVPMVRGMVVHGDFFPDTIG